MKVLKSMLLAATLMLLSASTVFCQGGIVDVAMRDAAFNFEISIADDTDRERTFEVAVPLSPLTSPVTVEILDFEGNIVYMRTIDAEVMRTIDAEVIRVGLPSTPHAARLVVTQAGIIVADKDVQV